MVGSRTTRTMLVAMLVAVTGIAADSFAGSLDLARTVPDDAVVALLVTPKQLGDGQMAQGSSLGLAAMLADQAQALGLLKAVDTTTRAWIDTLSAISVLRQHPHVAAVFEIQAKRTDRGGHKLAGLSAALIVDTAGAHERVEERIQHLLTTYTNTTESTLAQSTVDGATLYTLRDRRLPDWCVLQWGPIDKHYVVTIGEGTFDHVRSTLDGEAPSLALDDWFETAHAQTKVDDTVFSLYSRFDSIDFAGDSELARKVGTVRRSMNLSDVDRGFWAVGFDGRALDVREVLRRHGKNQVSRSTMKSLPGVELDRLIPPAATGYAIFDSTPATSLRASCEVYLSMRSEESQAKTRAYWRDLEQAAGVDIQQDIVAHLARGAVMHNYPPHMLKLPFAWTFIARVDSNGVTANSEDIAKRVAGVRAKIDALCKAWQDQLAETGTVRLRQENDGLWFLDIGIPGPAVGMRGPWIVVSYSPFAVRENLRFLTEAPSSPLGEQAGVPGSGRPSASSTGG